MNLRYSINAHRPKPLAFGSHSGMDHETLVARKALLDRWHQKVLQLAPDQRQINNVLDLIRSIGCWLTHPESEQAWILNSATGNYEPVPDIIKATEDTLLDISRKVPWTKNAIVTQLTNRETYTPPLPFWEQLNMTDTIQQGLETLEEMAKIARIPVKLSAMQAKLIIPPDKVITAKAQLARRFLTVIKLNEKNDEQTFSVADDIVRWLVQPSPLWYCQNPDKKAPDKDDYLPIPEAIRLAEAAILALASEIPGYRHHAIRKILYRDKDTSPYIPSSRFWDLLNEKSGSSF